MFGVTPIGAAVSRSILYSPVTSSAGAPSVSSYKMLPPSLRFQLNEEDLALAEACLDGLAEEDTTMIFRFHGHEDGDDGDDKQSSFVWPWPCYLTK